MTTAGRTRSGRGRLGHILSSLIVAIGCVLFLGGFLWGVLLYQPYAVPTDSMAPTVAAGDRVLAQRIDGEEARRGDVVVFRDSLWGDLPMAKRVVGVGGDTVTCCDGDGRLTVNGQAVRESYLRDSERASAVAFEATVPEGDLFLLGDNRSGSLDSRVHLQDAGQGAVRRAAVEARVEATVWPLGGSGMLPRPDGFAQLPGGVSQPGPLGAILAAVAGGAVLILGGAAYVPIVRVRMRRSRLTHNGETHG